MGQALLGLIANDAELRLTGAGVSASSASLGKSIETSAGPVIVTSDPAAAIASADVVIDFALPAAANTNLAACVAKRCPLVIGTTGHEPALLEAIDRAAAHIPIVLAPNMSLGVNLLLGLAQLAAKTLGEDYDAEIFEAHHRHKKDAPSGTALAIGKAVAAGRGTSLEAAGEFARHGVTGARVPGKIGFSVLRGGDIIGEHVLTFAGPGERVEITHRAHDRSNFARGALVAARWLRGRAPAVYSMQDVLNLRSS
jgi:4-hydroxy-tetrahydrodipicolinate reductase